MVIIFLECDVNILTSTEYHNDHILSFTSIGIRALVLDIQ